MRSRVSTVGLPLTISERVGSFTPIFLDTQAIVLPRMEIAALMFRLMVLRFWVGGCRGSSAAGRCVAMESRRNGRNFSFGEGAGAVAN